MLVYQRVIVQEQNLSLDTLKWRKNLVLDNTGGFCMMFWAFENPANDLGSQKLSFYVVL